MSDLERRLEDLFTSDAHARRVSGVRVASIPRAFGALAFVGGVALLTLALVAALSLVRDGRDIATRPSPSVSPSTGGVVVPSPSGSSAAPTPTPSASPPSPTPSASAVPSAAPASFAPAREYTNAQWNFHIAVPDGWRRSYELSTVAPNHARRAGTEVYTARTLDDELALGTSADSAAWNGTVVVSTIRADGQSARSLAGSLPDGTGATRPHRPVDGRDAVERDLTDGTTHVFVVDGVLGYDIGYRLGSPRPSVATEELLRGIDETFRFIAPASRPGTGTIAGALRYPSEYLPAQHVCAIDLSDSAHRLCVDTPQSNEQVWYRIRDVPPGTYVVVAYLTPPPAANPDAAGGYTAYIACGATSACAADHTLVELSVDAGAYLAGIDPGDWYAPPGTYPPRQ